MTVVLKSPDLEAGGFSNVTVVDAEDDYAYLSDQHRISGATRSARATELLDQAQLAYKLDAWDSDTVIVSVCRNETLFCRAIISLFRNGNLQLSLTREADSLADCIRSAIERLKI